MGTILLILRRGLQIQWLRITLQNPVAKRHALESQDGDSVPMAQPLGQPHPAPR
jgi:hypothetical protein